MEKEIIKDTIVDGVCSDENKDNEGKKKPRKKDYKAPPSGMSLDHSGDLVVNTNPGYKRSKLFNIK